MRYRTACCETERNAFRPNRRLVSRQLAKIRDVQFRGDERLANELEEFLSVPVFRFTGNPDDGRSRLGFGLAPLFQ
jgi:hypothetical protein